MALRTGEAAVALAAFGAGAVMAAGPPLDAAYLEGAARAGATVVAAAPPPPAAPGGVVDAALGALGALAGAAVSAGVAPGRVVLDAGLDACPPGAGPDLLRASDRLAALGHALLVTADAAVFAGREAALAAAALGVARGARLVRTRDVAGTRRVCDVVAAVLEAA